MTAPRTAAGRALHTELWHQGYSVPGARRKIIAIEAEAAAAAESASSAVPTALLRALVDGLTEGRFMDELAAARAYLEGLA